VPPGPYGTFDGGYAQVIRATDYPVPPANRVRPPKPARPADPAHPAHPANSASAADPDVFVYRDTSGEPDGPAAGISARDQAEHDSAYWYSLLSEDAAPVREETRGPFEPLVSSDDPPPRAAHDQPALPGPASPGAERDTAADDTALARARKLEQLKDLYLTAEAIGEHNVDKHFDQLLARQRELISDYFRQSSAAGPAQTGPADAGPVVAGPRDGTQEDAGVATEQPRAW
jgi:hypothetical protein